MRYFIHQGSGAVVYVDAFGHKTIEKHGRCFATFHELHRYETQKKYVDNTKDRQQARVERLRYKGEV